MNLKEIISGFNAEDGSHPDFPIKVFYYWEELKKKNYLGYYVNYLVGSLVIYNPNDGGKIDHIGIISSVNKVGEGIDVIVTSIWNDQEWHHKILESPSGKQPAYSLMKEHIPRDHAP